MFIFLYWCGIYSWLLIINLVFVDKQSFHYTDLYIMGAIAFIIVKLTRKLVTRYLNNTSDDDVLSKKEKIDNDFNTVFNFTFYVSFAFMLSYGYVYKDMFAIANNIRLLTLVAGIALVIVYFIVFIKNDDKKENPIS